MGNLLESAVDICMPWNLPHFHFNLVLCLWYVGYRTGRRFILPETAHLQAGRRIWRAETFTGDLLLAVAIGIVMAGMQVTYSLRIVVLLSAGTFGILIFRRLKIRRDSVRLRAAALQEYCAENDCMEYRSGATG